MAALCFGDLEIRSSESSSIVDIDKVCNIAAGPAVQSLLSTGSTEGISGTTGFSLVIVVMLDPELGEHDQIVGNRRWAIDLVLNGLNAEKAVLPCLLRIIPGSLQMALFHAFSTLCRGLRSQSSRADIEQYHDANPS